MTTPLILFAAGSRLTAAELDEIQPAQVVKPTTQSVTSSTTLQNDSALLLPLAVANAVYIFRAVLAYKGGTMGSSDLKFQWTVPSGANLVYALEAIGTAGGAFTGTGFSAASLVAAGTQGATNCAALLYGTLTVGSTTGSLQLEWAQNTSSATATQMQAGSSLELARVS